MVPAASRTRLSTTLCALAIGACTSDSGPEIRSATGFSQGTTYSLQWMGGAAEAEMEAAAEQELERIDMLLSNYRADSALERFNTMRSVQPVELAAELVTLLELAKKTYAASDGCFDPTVRPLVRAWGFDGAFPAVPPPEAIAAARARVGLDRLEVLDATHVRKTHPELEIDMASIGQGYTVARLAGLLEQHGSVAYLAEIGGEVVARGSKPGDVPWRVGIERPEPDGAPTAPGPTLQMPADRPTAVVTSGSYRHYLDVEGRRLGHIIDPRTAWPVDHGLQSVTVVGDDAATAAAWGTALLCLGPAAAIATAERERVAALLWIGDSDSVELELTPAFVAEWSGLLAGPGGSR